MSHSPLHHVFGALATFVAQPLLLLAEPPLETSEAVALPEFSVKADKISGYMATETTSGTRIATPIMNLPYSIQVITNDFFNDFQLFDLDDQIPFISNATPGDKYIGGGGGTRIRGFIAPYFRNGFIRRQAPDGSSIDRVEVVKGPASAIYGRAAPGGVINYISKKPSSTAEQMFSYSLGTYDNQRTEVSSTGPLVPTKLFYRVDGAFYDYERTTDFWYNRTMNLSGSVQYKLSATSAITLEMEHTTRVMNDFQNFVRYTEVETDPATPQTIVRRGLVYDMPTNVYGDLGHRLARFNQAGPHRRTVRQNNSYYLTFEQKLDPVFSVRANGTYTTRWFEQETGGPLEWNTSPATLTGLPTNPTSTIARYGALAAGLPGYWSGDRSFTRRTIADIQAGGQIDLTANYTIGGVKNRTLITFDFLEDETNNDTWLLSGTPLRTYMASTGYSESDINFWSRPNPYQLDRYRALPDPIFDPAVFPLSDASTFNIFNTLWGGLVSHTLELMNGRLIFIGTARKDFITIHREQPLSTDPQLKDAQQKFDIFTYSTGANFHFIRDAVVGFVSTGKSFNPAPQVDPNTGQIHGNTSANGVEVGIKGAVFNRRLSYTLVTFRTTQENEVTDNPAWVNELDPTIRESLARYAGGQRSRTSGMGLDLSGQVTDRWSLLGSMSWTDAHISANQVNPSLVGRKLPFPIRSGSMGTSYSFNRAGWLRGTSVGLTYLYRPSYLRIVTATTPAAFTDDLYVPGQSDWSGYISYSHSPFAERKKLRISYKVNVQNIFDRRVTSVGGYYPVGREAAITTSVRF